MRKSACGVFMVALLLIACVSGAHAQDEIKLVFENQPMELSPPGYLIDGSAYFPALPYLQVMGADVTWDQPRQAVIAVKGTTRLVMFMGEKDRLVNEKVVTKASVPRVIDDTPYVSMRFAPRYLGYRVKWDKGALTASLSPKGGSVPGTDARLLPKAVPELLWVGEGDYANGGISPIGGSHLQPYTFEVLYRHPDGRYPEEMVLLTTTAPLDAAAWHLHGLEEVRRLGEGFADGVVYGVTLPPGFFPAGAGVKYYFRASDGIYTFIR